MARETEKERVDREVIELLNELRVTLPGVQVLFAFLLILPFQATFSDLTDFERGIYLIAFLFSTAATIVLIAPATYHRIQFRAGDKLRMLFLSNWLVVAGSVCLAVAITAAVFLITEVVVGDATAALISAVVALALTGFWYGLPIYGRLRGPSGPTEGGEED